VDVKKRGTSGIAECRTGRTALYNGRDNAH
jgi:hypothetical protein